jgi:tRNA G10  N-methylase Trm11
LLISKCILFNVLYVSIEIHESKLKKCNINASIYTSTDFQVIKICGVKFTLESST